MITVKCYWLVAFIFFNILIARVETKIFRIVSTEHPDITKEREALRMRRNADIVGAVIQLGTSLAHTSLTTIQATGYQISVGGTIENYSKYMLRLKNCENKHGAINEAMRDVGPGIKEAFASHNTDGAVTGTQVYCKFEIMSKNAFLHIMYYVPNSGYYNYLALGLTKGDPSWTADYLYTTDPSTNAFFTRKAITSSYHDDAELCEVGFCVKGDITSESDARISIALYPRKFGDLVDRMQDNQIQASSFRTNEQIESTATLDDDQQQRDGESEEDRKKRIGAEQYDSFLELKFEREWRMDDNCKEKVNKKE